MVLSQPLIFGLLAFGAVVSVGAGVVIRRLDVHSVSRLQLGVTGLVAGTLFPLATLGSAYFRVVPGPLWDNLVVNAVVVSLPIGALFGFLGFPAGTSAKARAAASIGFGAGCVVLLVGALFVGQL
ncbi:hypothetical protein E6P09_13190 [Haloferax mediterranei ATCC 33500]|uniref:Uncharacterized protein n=1 Tax=Haloferax mediterranei (strain ATCC 33500 / DSM 1411 / JCM 8866 / NBRC 14739 / NCIMB 2177 / R-4) TaxID=523841 RepID=M0IT70_HALMT|nr:hypothetical protein [Haloferax mediterranei]AHZ23760.1 hypothetical protein BM92_14405 [Haloferax mediterranei ATCC 33500]ELZ99252.1 hypothetical protein C439_15374 [Haloferax mediterranei ATCC 33500]MDX5986849.1 hypothetical protein [Haloferax mediterranei ATCC 33500]QCQ76173.1 hypothetical protein E6P09_13190 [Haloferax mediterranei ATCC 33500]